MKSVIKYTLPIIILSCVFACNEQLDPYSEPDNKLHFTPLPGSGDTIVRYTFVYEEEDVILDTLWIEVETMGYVENYDRKVSIKQVESIEPQAISGEHFVPLDDPAVTAEFYWVRAGRTSAEIPILAKRHPDMKDNEFNLRLEIAENEDFKRGYNSLLYRNVTIADMLVRPDKWVAPNTFYFLGDYGKVKHQFMIDVLRPLGYKADDEFIDMVALTNPPDMALTAYWGGYFTEKLIELNTERKLQGLDVLREEPETEGALGAIVRFYINQQPQPYE